MSNRRITVDGVEYPVVERLPNDPRIKPTVVRMPTGDERVAVWRHGRWEWWRVEDRIW